MAENIEETSYDILEWFPILFCQEVFKYLDGNDVIQASAVNKQWYEFTGERQQMKKVKLIVYNMRQNHLTFEVMDMLKNSKRQHQHIELKYIPPHCSEFVLGIIAKHTGSWKSVKILWCEMESLEMWNDILRSIEPSVEELTFQLRGEGLDRPKPAPGHKRWIFPCLKSLECSGINLFKSFHCCKSLIKISFPKLVSHEVLPVLQNNHSLEEVQTLCGFFFKHSYNFKLRKLWVNGSFRNYPEDVFCTFLQTQASSLEALEAQDVIINQDCLNLILTGMPKLSTLTTDFFQMDLTLMAWQGAFPVNTTITTLEFTEGVSMVDFAFEIIIRALRGLKHYKCRDIDDVIFNCLAEHVPALESLETKKFNVTTLPGDEIFPNIKKFKADWFTEDLRESIRYFNSDFSDMATRELRKYFRTVFYSN